MLLVGLGSLFPEGRLYWICVIVWDDLRSPLIVVPNVVWSTSLLLSNSANLLEIISGQIGLTLHLVT